MLNISNRLKLILTGVIFLIIAGHFSTINANFASGYYLNAENSDITAGSGVELEIEYWMADAGYWSVSPFFEAGESVAELEDWMADASYWSLSPLYEADESAAEFEDWMADTSRWNSSFNKCTNLPRPVIHETPLC